MAIMAAGVHPPFVFAGKGQAGLFSDRQSVHIGAKGDGLFPAGIKEGGKTIFDGFGDLAVQILKLLIQIALRLRQVESEFRNLMQRRAPFFELLEFFISVHAIIINLFSILQANEETVASILVEKAVIL